MLGVLFVAAGLTCLVVGGIGATRYIDTQTDQPFFSLSFFSLVVAPLLGGAILVVIGLMEFF
jgi:hypothetical protein